LFLFIYQIDSPCARKECRMTIWRTRCWTPESHTNNRFRFTTNFLKLHSHHVQCDVITSSGKKSGYLENILTLISLYLENKWEVC